MKHFSLIAVAVLVVLAGPVAAQSGKIYQWKDEKGNLVVSDRPPENPSKQYDTVRLGSSSAPGKVWDSPGTGENERLETLIPGGEAPQQEEFQKKPELCQSAKDNLDNLNTYARIRMRNDAGELIYLSEEEKAAQREEATRLMRLHCE